MADSLRVDNRKEIRRSLACGNIQPIKSLVASIPRHCSNALQCIVNVDQSILGTGMIAEVGHFLLKLAVLEAARRLSKSHCPFLWHTIQGLQCICLPPFKWIQSWGFFRGLVKCMQWGTQSRLSEDWMLQLSDELEKEGIVLPERITEADLCRFYQVAKGDFTRFLSSVKRTMNWRQNFTFMSPQELEDWSEMVFWHGVDVKQHPCLIIRVQSACFNVLPQERFRLPEVVVSQIEYGILHLVHTEDPLITVLMDCEGLSPFGFPVHMMRSCAILLQDHYPNRLAALFVIRLPPIARVIAQTLFQVLRPGTRRKLRILGEDYQKVLSEHLQTLPSFLGGDCSCSRCSNIIVEVSNVVGTSTDYEAKNVPSLHSAYRNDDLEFIKCEKVLKSIIIGLLLLSICIAFGVNFHSLEGIQLYRRGGR